MSWSTSPFFGFDFLFFSLEISLNCARYDRLALFSRRNYWPWTLSRSHTFYKIATLSKNVNSYVPVLVFLLVKVCMTVHFAVLFWHTLTFFRPTVRRRYVPAPTKVKYGCLSRRTVLGPQHKKQVSYTHMFSFQQPSQFFNPQRRVMVSAADLSCESLRTIPPVYHV